MALHLLRNSVDKLGSRAITKGIFTKPATGLSPTTIHVTAQRDYPQAAELPLPPNIDPAETMRFSPQRSRDISSNAMICHEAMQVSNVDVTLDSGHAVDPHVEQYDCSGAVHLSCSMQSNVPQPFSGGSKSMHLNMPGGQWSQFTKFTAADLQDHHYMTLRRDLKGMSACGRHERFIAPVLTHKVHQYVHLLVPLTHERTQSVRLCTTSREAPKGSSEATKGQTEVSGKELSRKDKLKAAVKDYGATVIVFHVTISLASLGLFYLLVSSGLDVKQMLSALNLGESALAGKVATEASTFVVAYAIHKVFAPVRISITLGATPFIVRYLRKRGILKVKSP